MAACRQARAEPAPVRLRKFVAITLACLPASVQRVVRVTKAVAALRARRAHRAVPVPSLAHPAARASRVQRVARSSTTPVAVVALLVLPVELGKLRPGVAVAACRALLVGLVLSCARLGAAVSLALRAAHSSTIPAVVRARRAPHVELGKRRRVVAVAAPRALRVRRDKSSRAAAVVVPPAQLAATSSTTPAGARVPLALHAQQARHRQAVAAAALRALLVPLASTSLAAGAAVPRFIAAAETTCLVPAVSHVQVRAAPYLHVCILQVSCASVSRAVEVHM